MCPSLAEPDSGDFPRRKLPFIGRQRSDSADSHAVVFPGSRIQLLALKITFSPIQKTHTGTTLSVCVFLFAIFLKNYLTNRKTYAIIKVLCEFFTVRGVTQLGRVLALGARCRRFESCHLDQTKGLCKLQSPFSLKPADFLNLRALLNLLQSSI